MIGTPLLALGVLAIFSLFAVEPVGAEQMPGMAMGEARFAKPLLTREAQPQTEIELMFMASNAKKIMQTTDEMGMPMQEAMYEQMYEPALAFRLAPIRRLGLEVRAPLVIRDPRDDGPIGGPGDVRLGAKYLVFESREIPFLLSVGSEIALPTGSLRRDLGGKAEAEPFLAAGAAFGNLSLQADVSYAVRLNRFGTESREQRVKWNLTAAYFVHPRVSPLLELNFVNVGIGRERGSQLALTPGLRVEVFERFMVGAGVQFPVLERKEFFYRAVASAMYMF